MSVRQGINDVAKNTVDIKIGINDQAKKVIRGLIGVNGVAKLFWDGGGVSHKYPALYERYQLNRNYNFPKVNIYETLEAMWNDVLFHVAPNSDVYNNIKTFRETYTQTIYSDIASNKTVEDTIYIELFYRYYTMSGYPKDIILTISLGDTDTTNKSLSSYFTWYLEPILSSTISQKTKGFTIEYNYQLSTGTLSKSISQGMYQIGQIGRFYNYEEGSVGFTAYDDMTAVQYRINNIGIKTYSFTLPEKMIADFDFTDCTTFALNSSQTLVLDKTDTDVGVVCPTSGMSLGSNGLTLTNNYVILPKFWLEGELYNLEIDVVSLIPYGSAVNYLLEGETVVSQQTLRIGLGYNNNQGLWYWYDNDGTYTYSTNLNLSGANYFNGHTVKIEVIRSTKSVKIYRDNNLIATVASKLLFERNFSLMLNNITAYLRFSTMILSGLRIWYEQ